MTAAIHLLSRLILLIFLITIYIIIEIIETKYFDEEIMKPKYLRETIGEKKKKISNESNNVSLRGSNIILEGMTNYGTIEYKKTYPFNHLIPYNFILQNSQIELGVQSEDKNNILEEEQVFGYDAFECYDSKKYRYIYYISNDYDMFDFVHHVLKKYFQQQPIIIYTYYIVKDINEL